MSALDRPFSYSQLSQYLRCPKSHDYSYRQGLQKLAPSRALQLGTLVDAGLTAALIGREDPGSTPCDLYSTDAIVGHYEEWSTQADTAALLELSPTLKSECDQTRDDAISIADRAIVDLQLDTGRWETLRDKDGTLAVQYEARAPLRHHEHGYLGYLDWCATDTTTGNTWLIDFKTRKQFDSEEALSFDYQLSSYQKAVEGRFEKPFTGVALYQIRSRVPHATELKRGGLSKAANQSCDWPTYERSIGELMLNPSAYAGMREKLPKFQTFTWTMRSPEELNAIWEQIEEGARVLVEAHRSKRPALRALNMKTCAWCDYKDLCMGELKGWDTDHIRESEFRVRETHAGNTATSSRS